VPEGATLEMRGVDLGVTMEDYTGNVDFRSEAGSCFIRKLKGDLYARSQTGGMAVTEVTGKTDIYTASGTILAGRLLGAAELRTSVGSVELMEAGNPVKVRGDDADVVLGLSQQVPAGLDIKVSMGRIILNVDNTLALTVDASTRLLGKVRMRGLVPQVKQGGFERSSVLADLNGGGKTVRLRTAGGTISVVGREPLDTP